MRKYADLNKEERENHRAYQMACLNNNLEISTTLILAVIFFIPGVILMFTNTIGLLLIGAIFLLEGTLFITLLIFERAKGKKRLLLIYGYVDSVTELFEIKREDETKVKRINKFVLEEEKKNG